MKAEVYGRLTYPKAKSMLSIAAASSRQVLGRGQGNSTPLGQTSQLAMLMLLSCELWTMGPAHMYTHIVQPRMLGAELGRRPD